MKRMRPHPTGFTLLEGLIATAVFLIGIAGVLGALTQARASSTASRRDMLAQAVVTDLVEQIEGWAYDDPRLASPTADPCKVDPSDRNGALLSTGSDRTSFLACASSDPAAGGATWSGLPNDVSGMVQFPNGQDNVDSFQRVWVVREETRDGARVDAASQNSGVRKQVFVHVTYQLAGNPRRVTGFATKYRPGGL